VRLDAQDAAMRHGPHERDVQSIADAIRQATDDVQATYRRGDGLAGLSTGIPALDEKTGGLAPSDPIILAGRTAGYRDFTGLLAAVEGRRSCGKRSPGG
jgi:replicative DNA helicase